MNFARAGSANHAHNLAAGRAANNGIINEHDALAFDEMANRVQFELDTEIANRLRRLDESAPYVVVANERLTERNAALSGEAEGCRHARVGHRHNEIGVDIRFARK